MDKSYRVRLSFFLAVLFLMISSCAQKAGGEADGRVEKEEKKLVEKFNKQRKLAESRRYIPPSIPPPIPAPTYQEIDPFEGKKFTMSAVGAPLIQVLYSIADGAGMNLIISPEVNAGQSITATFSDVPLKEALDIVMDLTGLYYEIRGNVLYIKEMMTKTFKLPYISTVTNFNSSLGGDVLGGALSGGIAGGVTGGVGGAGFGTSGLRGNFTIDYQSPQGATDFFAQLEDNLKSVLSERGKYTLNRFTGTLVVTDRRKNVEKVEKLIKRLLEEVGRQVLIEAKIVELALSDQFEFGIDWGAFFRDVFALGGNITITQSLALQSGGFGNINVVSGDFNMIVNALSSYGKVYTLSNPRILVSNGQTALIATGQITPFFERQAISFLPGGGLTQQVQESILRTNVLEGVLLGVTPYISDKGEIVMNIIPVATRLEGTKRLLDNGRVLAEAPILNIKESGTIIRVRDGQLIVIGGLIGDVTRTYRDKIPGLGDIPFLGNLFTRKRVLKEKRELIIFIKPTVVGLRDI